MIAIDVEAIHRRITTHRCVGFVPRWRGEVAAFEVWSPDNTKRYGSMLTDKAIVDKMTNPVNWYLDIVRTYSVPEPADPLGR
jgi:hypothetical protein